MALAATQVPTYPISGQTIKVTFTPSGGVNFVRIWVTDAPIGSDLKKRLDDSGADRIKVFEGDTSSTWEFIPDLGGVFVFTAQEYTLNSGTFGGGYKDDPDGYATETKVGSEQSITVTTGSHLSMPIGTDENRAQLELWVFGDTIRATSFEHHGSVTPAITGASTTRSKTAAADSAVVTALAALDGTTASTALGTITTILRQMLQAYDAHRQDTGAHASADSTNLVKYGFLFPGDVKSSVTAAQKLVTAIRSHMNSDNGTGIGTGSWHQVSGNDTADLVNTIFVDSPSDMAGVISAAAAAYLAYEAHRVDTTYHVAADTTNTFPSLPKLLEVHRAFLASLRSTSPTVPATVNTGVPVLVSGAGMKEV